MTMDTRRTPQADARRLPTGRWSTRIVASGSFFWLALIAVAYYGAAKLGMSLSVSRGVITPVWAPSGIALASLLILGRSLLARLAIGAFTANATSGATLAIAAGISVGNTLAAVVGAVLVQRIGFTPALDRFARFSRWLSEARS